MRKSKVKQRCRRILSGVLASLIALPNLMQLTASAEGTEKYPYMMFGRNGIIMSASSNLCMNGNAHTNKEADMSYLNGNINGKVTTGADIEKRVKHVYADTKINETYFTENCELYENSYVRDEMNIHINNPVFSYGNIELDGNVALNSNMGTLMNINVTGEVKNANTSVVYSKYGDITIENDSTANINGLIYCPLGTLTIDSPNINLNGVIIADKIVINGSSVNINYKDDIASFIGTTSEVYDFSGLEYLPEEWLGDTDDDGLFDIYEKVIDTDPFIPDTDGDELPDGYEVLNLNTDPLEIDTDENGISDADEDFDDDNLSNLGEYQNQTEPFNPDTDDDGFMDGDEVYTYGTAPLNPDTDNDGLLDGEESYDGSIYAKYRIYFDPLIPDTNDNGILDGDEVFGQSKKQTVSTNDEAITEIKVDMDTNGSLERNLTIESMYNIDAVSSDVYAMIGEPFNFTTTSGFTSATITFKIDKSKLGDTLFDNLIILWYNEEKQTFEEMPTTRNWENSTVSTTTTHFSQYLIVDSEKWYANWEASFNELRKMWVAGTSYKRNLNTIYLVDCSSSMFDLDSCGPSLVAGYNGVTEENIEEIRYSISSPWDAEYYCINWCDRAGICYNILKNKGAEDYSAIIGFSDTIVFNSGYTKDKEHLKDVIPKIHNGDGTAYLNTALNAAMVYVQANTTDLYRLIVITNNNITFDSISSDDFSDNVILNIVNLDSGAIGYGIEEVVQATGGDVYNVSSAAELTYQSGGFVASPEKFIGKDSDGDGIPDIVELYGLKPNGQPFNTNPYLRDTDADGLDDNVELNYIGSGITSNVTMAEYVRAIRYNSDPTKADTDDDGYCDYDEVKVYNSNPKVSNVIQEASLTRTEYINIKDNSGNISFGGNQSWFGNNKIQSLGCGLISSCDILIYLGITHYEKYSFVPRITYNLDGTINYNTYYDFVQFYYENYLYIMDDDDTMGTKIAKSLKQYMSDYGVKAKVNWANLDDPWSYAEEGIAFLIPFLNNKFDINIGYLDADYNVELRSRYAILDGINEMLDNDIPGMLAIGPYSKDSVLLFNSTKDIISNISSNSTKNHYVTVTATYYDDIADDYYLEVSSWGKKYYISYEDFVDKKDIFSGETKIKL